jgi:type IV pilus assembly protein PilB
MEFVDLRKVEPDASADQMLPERLAERFQALPISLDPEGVLTVAISDPTDVGASDELRIAAGRPIHLVVADVAALEELMDRVYGGSVTA